MKFSIFIFVSLIFLNYHYCHIQTNVNEKNISSSQNSLETTKYQIESRKSLILLFICLVSSIVLCLYAIFHNLPATSSKMKQINVKKTRYNHNEQEIVKSENDSLSSSTEETKSILSKTNRSNRTDDSL